jgi:hypothetical protein
MYMAAGAILLVDQPGSWPILTFGFHWYYSGPLLKNWAICVLFSSILLSSPVLQLLHAPPLHGSNGRAGVAAMLDAATTPGKAAEVRRRSSGAGRRVRR